MIAVGVRVSSWWCRTQDNSYKEVTSRNFSPGVEKEGFHVQFSRNSVDVYEEPFARGVRRCLQGSCARLGAQLILFREVVDEVLVCRLVLNPQGCVRGGEQRFPRVGARITHPDAPRRETHFGGDFQ